MIILEYCPDQNVSWLFENKTNKVENKQHMKAEVVVKIDPNISVIQIVKQKCKCLFFAGANENPYVADLSQSCENH